MSIPLSMSNLPTSRSQVFKVVWVEVVGGIQSAPVMSDHTSIRDVNVDARIRCFVVLKSRSGSCTCL